MQWHLIRRNIAGNNTSLFLQRAVVMRIEEWKDCRQELKLVKCNGRILIVQYGKDDIEDKCMCY